MKKETFKTVLAMCQNDPLTEEQRQKLNGDDAVVTIAEASQLLGLAISTIRKLPIPRLKTNRYVRYMRKDVIKYRDSKR